MFMAQFKTTYPQHPNISLQPNLLPYYYGALPKWMLRKRLKIIGIMTSTKGSQVSLPKVTGCCGGIGGGWAEDDDDDDKIRLDNHFEIHYI